MTSAKPQPMAGQTEAPDDLIAELAKLMAEDAKADTTPAAPVRIPGADAPPVAAAQPAPPIRIPGGDQPTPPPADEAAARPFSFDFDIGAKGTPAGPVTPLQAAEPPPAPHEPEPVAPWQDSPAPPADTGHDSIADLIAAEFASDAGPVDEPAAVEPLAPPRSADNFGVPPVFGLGANVPATPPQPVESPALEAVVPPPSAPASPPPRASGDDSLDDIERLVGPAVHLEPAPPSPALRSLATPTLPPGEPREAAPGRKSPPADNSIEEAILAAAAATGASVEYVGAEDTPFETEGEAAPVARAPRRVLGMTRGVAGPLVALALLVVAGLGLYWVLGNTGGTAGPAPLIVASAEPVKEVPAAATEAATPQSVVFNEISGVDTGADERIVSRDQSDVEAVNEGIGFGGAEDGLVNRKVRTVTVRPDGTIVSGDAGLAGAAMLPVDRPDVPEVPGADFSTPDMLASPDTAAPPPETAEPASPTTPPVQPGSMVAAVDATGAPIAGKSAPVPLAKPANYDQLVAALQQRQTLTPPAATQPAPVEPVATAPLAQQPAAPAAGSAAPAYVQLSSQRTEDAARQSAENIARRYGVLFGGASLEVQRVDLGERGIFYRVRVPAASLENANNICANVKAAGGDCFTM